MHSSTRGYESEFGYGPQSRAPCTTASYVRGCNGNSVMPKNLDLGSNSPSPVQHIQIGQRRLKPEGKRHGNINQNCKKMRSEVFMVVLEPCSRDVCYQVIASVIVMLQPLARRFGNVTFISIKIQIPSHEVQWHSLQQVELCFVTSVSLRENTYTRE